jgi:recombination protein RecT
MKVDGSDQNTKGNAANTAPLTEEERAKKSLQGQLTRMAPEFERALPKTIGTERMMRIAMTAILKTPTLALCEATSFMGSLLQALQLGLEVNTPLGQAYLIPRKKKEGNGMFHWECNFQIGYQGLLDLCYRYGKYKMITAEVVYDSDYFDYRYGTKQFLDHRPEWKKDAKPIKVWALYELENGWTRFVVWSWEEAMAHGEEFSDSFNKDKPWASPWLANETAQEEMAKKSVLKALLKYAPKSVEGQIEAATYADGHAVIANKYEDGGNMKLAFDVKQIAAPDKEAQEFMNQVNGANKPTEEAETVPAGGNKGSDTAAKQQQAATPAKPAAAATGNTAPPKTVLGKPNGALFPADEAADLEGTEPPDFS